MAADSPPLSPLSPPPSWFGDDDTECPHSPEASPPSSPLSPTPSWIKDDCSEFPYFVWNAAESRLEIPTSPFSSTSQDNEENGESKSSKRPFEWLESIDESPAKRARSEETHVPSISGRSKEGRITNISDTVSQGGSSVFTEANEPGTPLSPVGELHIEVRPKVAESAENNFPGKGKPEVWATLRGGLCEALPYFRAYKGSLHTQDRTAMGFLIDKEASARDVFSSQVIISSV